MINLERIQPAIDPTELKALLHEAQECNQRLEAGTGSGADMLGWLGLPQQQTPDDIALVNAIAHSLRSRSDTVVVVGIGGSYLGARAVIEALSPHHPVHGSDNPEVLYAGCNLCPDYHSDLLDALDHRNYSVVMVSKSGTTIEPGLAFRLIKQHLEQQVGRHEAAQRTVVITDPEKGALREWAKAKGYRTMSIPTNVGGRFSVLTPVGLLPMAVAGIDISALMDGAKQAQADTSAAIAAEKNPACLYAAARNGLYRKGMHIELLASFSPKLRSLAEWWRQLFAESEGKQGKGIFPVSSIYTTDLHSIGQYVQQGERSMFETFVEIAQQNTRLVVPSDSRNLDGFNYLIDRPIADINSIAMQGTIQAHHNGGVPIIKMQLPQLSAYTMGYLLYTMERACAISGYMLGVNPFDQPGVEAYKANMQTLLNNGTAV